MSSAIKLPTVNTAFNGTFVKQVMDKINEIYFPKDGSYFRERVYWWETGTNLFIDMSRILKDMGATNDSSNDESISMTSIEFMSQFEHILSAMVDQIPTKLATLQWKCTNIEFSTYNSKQKTGKHKETGAQLYGAPACMFILHLDPLTPESIPVYKGKINNKSSDQTSNQYTMVGKPKTYTKNSTDTTTNTNANKDCSKCGKSFQPILAKYHECPACFVPRTTPMGGAGGPPKVRTQYTKK